MTILIFETEPWERDAFASLSDEHDLRFDDRQLTSETLDGLESEALSDTRIVSIFIYSGLDRRVLDRLPNLALIATRSTGVDHIDMDYCREKRIQVSNVPDYGRNTVAEHVFALLLSISHRVIEAAERTQKGDFSQKRLCGFDLHGRTMGILGTGSIGRHTARIAAGFGMKVIAFDIEPDEKAASRIGFDYVDMEALLRQSDVVSLHVPGHEETRHMISNDQFELMKDGVVLINTARGSVIDTRALLRAIEAGKVSAAGLDVLPEEPIIREEAELLRTAYSKSHDLETLLADHILLRLRNVIITPHSAFNTREAVNRILNTTRENIDGFLHGEPKNIVT